jgi:hypothetical protein
MALRYPKSLFHEFENFKTAKSIILFLFGNPENPGPGWSAP